MTTTFTISFFAVTCKTLLLHNEFASGSGAGVLETIRWPHCNTF